MSCLGLSTLGGRVWCARETTRKGCLGIFISSLGCVVSDTGYANPIGSDPVSRSATQASAQCANWCGNTANCAGCAGPTRCIWVALPVPWRIHAVSVRVLACLVMRLITWLSKSRVYTLYYLRLCAYRLTPRVLRRHAFVLTCILVSALCMVCVH